jgi:hypothetical protein
MTDLRPQEEVHVQVSQNAAVRMVQHFGRITEGIQGSVEPKGADSTAVTVWIGKDYPGTPFADVRQTVVLGRDEVIGLRQRRLSVWRTAVTAAAITAGFVWMTDRIFQWLPNNPGDDDPVFPPGTEDPVLSRIPAGWMFRIPIG